MAKTVLIAGGTGMLGEPVARKMESDGYQVRIATRSEADARRKFGPEFEVVQLDYEQASSVAGALEGCFGAHISLPTEVELVATQAIARAAAGKGLGRLTYISGASVSDEMRRFQIGDCKYRCEQAVRQSEVPYTVFRCTMFNETLPVLVRGGRAVDIGPLPHSWHFVAADDYAAMVSRSYGLAEAEGKTLSVHGPEAYTIGEALEKYIAVFHPEIKSVSTMPIWIFRVLAILRRSRRYASIADMYNYFKAAGEGGDPAEANSLLGAPATTLDEWLRERQESPG